MNTPFNAANELAATYLKTREVYQQILANCRSEIWKTEEAQTDYKTRADSEESKTAMEIIRRIKATLEHHADKLESAMGVADKHTGTMVTIHSGLDAAITAGNIPITLEEFEEQKARRHAKIQAVKAKIEEIRENPSDHTEAQLSALDSEIAEIEKDMAIRNQQSKPLAFLLEEWNAGPRETFEAIWSIPYLAEFSSGLAHTCQAIRECDEQKLSDALNWWFSLETRKATPADPEWMKLIEIQP